MAANRTADRNRRFALQFVSALDRSGVAAAVIAPGSRHTALLAAIVEQGFPNVVVLDERSAGFVALGWAKARRQPVAVICTSGSAGAHFLPAIVEAYEAGVPLIVITADRPPELLDIGAPQATKQDRFFGSHVKRATMVPSADEANAATWRDIVDSVALATTGKPGPIHLNLGFREPFWPDVAAQAEFEQQAALGDGYASTTDVTPDKFALPNVVQAGFHGSRRGLIVCGPQIDTGFDAEQRQAIRDLARGNRLPLLADVASGLRGGDTPELFLANYDALLRCAEVREKMRPDWVAHFGRIPTSKALQQWLFELEESGVDVWHINVDGQANSNRQSARILSMSATEFCGAVQLQGGPDTDTTWFSTWQQLDRQMALALAPHLKEDVCWEGAILAAIANNLPDQAQLLLASSMPIRDADSFAVWFPSDTRIHCNRGVNGIDGLIACAAGMAAAFPKRPTIAVLGDLAFQHDLGSLAAFAQLGLDNVTVVVINNGGGGIFEFLPIRRQTAIFEPYFLTPQVFKLDRACAAFSVHYDSTKSIAEFTKLLSPWPKYSRVIEVEVDRSINVEKHLEVWQIATNAAHSFLQQEVTHA